MSLTIANACGCVYYAIGRDLNSSGVGAIVCADMAVGEKVTVRLENRKLAAFVRNRNGNRYGFEFVTG